jgi:hypothetical protein
MAVEKSFRSNIENLNRGTFAVDQTDGTYAPLARVCNSCHKQIKS